MEFRLGGVSWDAYIDSGVKRDDPKWIALIKPALADGDMPYEIDNLLVAGRCLSATFEAQSGCRLVMLCLHLKQVAGTASVLSLKAGIAPRKVNRLPLQRQLLADGMNLGQPYRPLPSLPDAPPPR